MVVVVVVVRAAHRKYCCATGIGWRPYNLTTLYNPITVLALVPP